MNTTTTGLSASICPDCGTSHNRQGIGTYTLCITCARKAYSENPDERHARRERERAAFAELRDIDY